MSRRIVLVAGAAAGAGAAALVVLAAIGTPDPTGSAEGWTGWTGRVDAVSVADRAAMTPDDPVAVALLTRSSAAASRVEYSGVATTSDSAGTVTTRISHVPGSGTVAQSVGVAAGAVQVTPAASARSFAEDGRTLDLLRVNYRVLRDARLDTQVAGRPADAVVAVDAAGVLQARYWLDHATGLLLRRELLDSRGAVRERSGFTSVRIGSGTAVVPPSATPDPWRQLDAAGLAQARRSGCACPDALPGGLQLLDSSQAPAGTVSSAAVTHQLFSDGLVSVSLFSLPGDISPDDATGLAGRGFQREELAGSYAWVRGGTKASPSATVVWACRGSVLTLIADDAADPRSLAAAVLAAFPSDPDPAADTFWSRVDRGWSRITGRAA